MRHLYFISFLFILIQQSFGQPFFHLIGGNMNGSSESLFQTSSSDILVCGHDEYYDMFLYKTTLLNQEKILTKYTSPYVDNSTVVKEAMDGNFIMAGYVGEPDSISSSKSNIYVSKCDTNSSLLWNYELNLGSGDKVFDFEQKIDSSICLVGEMDGGFTIGNNPQGFLLMISNKGDSIFFKKYGIFERIIGIELLADESFIFCGYDKNHLPVVVRVNESGEVIWNFDEELKDKLGKPSDFLVSNNSSIYICGNYKNEMDGFHSYLLKLSTNGQFEWVKPIENHLVASVTSIDFKKNNEFLVFAGSINDSDENHEKIYCLKTDLDGNIIWEKSFGDSPFQTAHDVIITQENEFILTGNYNYSKLFLLKTDSLGNAPNFPVSITEQPNCKLEWSVYPNPAENYFMIQGLKNELYQIHIVDDIGRVIIHCKSNLQGSLQISASDLESGFYQVVLLQNGNVVSMKKLIIAE